jgi:uncharacterized protein YbaR (Trm112 family)
LWYRPAFSATGEIAEDELPPDKGSAMWSRSLEVLRCRACSGSYELHATETAGDEVLAGELSCTGCKQRVPIEDAIPRFVPRQNYASSFGFQWKRFGELQVDRLHSHTMSRDAEAGASRTSSSRRAPNSTRST